MALMLSEKSAMPDICGSSIGSITIPNGSFTPTQDCWCVGNVSPGTSSSAAQVIVTNGSSTKTLIIYVGDNSQVPVCVPIKAGLTVSTRNKTGQIYDLYFYAT